MSASCGSSVAADQLSWDSTPYPATCIHSASPCPQVPVAPWDCFSSEVETSQRVSCPICTTSTPSPLVLQPHPDTYAGEDFEHVMHIARALPQLISLDIRSLLDDFCCSLHQVFTLMGVCGRIRHPQIALMWISQHWRSSWKATALPCFSSCTFGVRSSQLLLGILCVPAPTRNYISPLFFTDCHLCEKSLREFRPKVLRKLHQLNTLCLRGLVVH